MALQGLVFPNSGVETISRHLQSCFGLTCSSELSRQCPLTTLATQLLAHDAFDRLKEVQSQPMDGSSTGILSLVDQLKLVCITFQTFPPSFKSHRKTNIYNNK